MKNEQDLQLTAEQIHFLQCAIGCYKSEWGYSFDEDETFVFEQLQEQLEKLEKLSNRNTK